eukprot:IDg13506t1
MLRPSDDWYHALKIRLAELKDRQAHYVGEYEEGAVEVYVWYRTNARGEKHGLLI